jgi:hypothetical protein
MPNVCLLGSLLKFYNFMVTVSGKNEHHPHLTNDETRLQPQTRIINCRTPMGEAAALNQPKPAPGILPAPGDPGPTSVKPWASCNTTLDLEFLVHPMTTSNREVGNRYFCSSFHTIIYSDAQNHFFKNQKTWGFALARQGSTKVTPPVFFFFFCLFPGQASDDPVCLPSS